MKPSILHIDFETRSAADLRKVGIYKYFDDPSTDVWCACWAVGDEAVQTWYPSQGTPIDIGAFIEDSPDTLIYAHNAGFEFQAFKMLQRRYGWPVPRIEQMRCTAAMAAAMALPRDLGGAANATGLPITKDDVGRRLMLQMMKPRSTTNGVHTWWDTPEKIERLAQYCATDVEVERLLEKRLRPLSDFEQKLWQLDNTINGRGVQVDLKSVGHARHLVGKATDELNAEVARLTNGHVQAITQAAAMRDWLNQQGVDTDSVDKASVKALLALDLPVDARRVLQIRQDAAKSSTAKLVSFQERASADGRARENLMFLGAGTGRWSARGIQLQNLPRPDMSSEGIELAFRLLAKRDHKLFDMLFGGTLSTVSNCLRGMIVAASGNTLLSADFSNIEGRVLAWLAGEEWKLQAFRDYDNGVGPDLYKLGASRILRKAITDITKDERQAYGKVPELALGYQGGVGAFQTMAVTYGVQVTDTEAEAIRDLWRENHPRTKQYWYDLEDAAMYAVRNPGKGWRVGKVAYACRSNILWCQLPSKRLLAYVDPKIQDVETPWGETKEAVTYMGVDSVTRKWSRHKAYGGLFAENVTQAVARDIMAEAMVRVEQAGFPIVLTVHDEIICEVAKARADKAEFERLMVELPSWAAGLPVSAEGDVTERYRK